MTTVHLKDLTRRFGEIAAVKHVNLAIDSGEMVAFLGPSGCGKTTTLRMITGLLQPSSGDVLFDGKSMLQVPTERRGAVMVFQKHLLFPTMNVGENVGFGLRMMGVKRGEIDARVTEMLRLVKLPDFERRRATELSGGQQQRVALARALVVRPNVLLLDEPLANLDANLRLEMRELIRTVQRDLQITTIFVTHDQEEAVMLADRIALMFDGVIQQYDRPQAFYQRPNSMRVARFFRNDNFLPGIKRGATVETALGVLQIDSEKNPISDGPVQLTVRPEEVQWASVVGTERPLENSLPAQVIEAIYMGTHTQVQLALGKVRWQAHAPADFQIQVGEMIRVRFPQQRIWLLPDGA